ncbi:hypothetical protein DOTSEDRAFT_44999 [Dothistroma septosporum NZE10]|uniref:non-specific serine/threonine protein kinase n=1 Tax=Dothistroma septosporum (strain NZE10 / CBS 128990) TaxID=675120 RepID=M2Y3P8_DOTSN|nr:hypothetical protein DOTSEDRAFT_44999 [Dothistroma septosporum NZE10]
MAQALAAIHHGFRYRGDGKCYQDEFAHSVIHGDFKEDQIFLRWNEQNIGGMPELVLGDFGAAKVVGYYSTVNPGTLIYNAPEDKAVYGNTKYKYETRQVFYDMVNSRTVQSDIYALGQVMYAMAAREPSYWPIGQDPSGLEISREYSTTGLKEAIRACLVTDPAQRADMSFKPGVGLLPAIEKLRNARDALIERRGPLDRMEFDPACGPPRLVRR